jgi:hypothetical protein
MSLWNEENTVEIYSMGMSQCSVCALVEMNPFRIAKIVNEMHPTGIESKWAMSTDTHFRDGQTNPCLCTEDKTRQHWLMVC